MAENGPSQRGCLRRFTSRGQQTHKASVYQGLHDAPPLNVRRYMSK